MNLSRISQVIIEHSFYLLIFLVPIIWLPVNYELFEFNKMALTYLVSVIIFGSWLVKAVSERKFYIRRTPLDILLLIFLGANTLSTLFSMDWHMSVFGYYSRFNGGLLSTVSYIFLYFAFTTHMDKTKTLRFLLIGFVSAVVVAIYGVLQHPNPLFRAEDGSFRGIDQGFWDIKSHLRSFSFLGQQNWFAAYMSIFFLVSTSFLLIFKESWKKFIFLASSSLMFLGFTFAYSRGATVGMVFGIATFLFFLFVRKRTALEKAKDLLPFVKKTIRLPNLGKNWYWIAALTLTILIVNYFFGNAFSERGASVEVEQTSITQLEVEGTQTGRIRLIVWKGALEIFKDNPIFGSGVETFANSYYLHKPAEHNLVNEWDFLYNKAHNEYLNYLATTGIVGTFSYLALILYFVYLAISWLYKAIDNQTRFLVIGIFAGYISYLFQNIFGFSVVILSILFFLAPAFFFILTQDKAKYKTILSEKYFNFTKYPIWENTTYVLSIVLSLILLLSVVNMWVADFHFARGLGGKTGSEVYNGLKNAVRLRPDQPLFVSELAGVEASISAKTKDKELAEELEADSLRHIRTALNISPADLGVWRNKLRVYFELSKTDKKYVPEAIQTAEKTAELAPTDAKIHYNLALFYLLEDTKEAIEKSNEVLIKVLGWKPDYTDARIRLAKNYIDQGKELKAREELEEIIDKNPENIEALDLLDSLK